MNTKQATVEALLFVSSSELSIKKTADAFGMKEIEVEGYLEKLEEKYNSKLAEIEKDIEQGK